MRRVDAKTPVPAHLFPDPLGGRVYVPAAGPDAVAVLRISAPIPE